MSWEALFALRVLKIRNPCSNANNTLGTNANELSPTASPFFYMHVFGASETISCFLNGLKNIAGSFPLSHFLCYSGESQKEKEKKKQYIHIWQFQTKGTTGGWVGVTCGSQRLNSDVIQGKKGTVFKCLF